MALNMDVESDGEEAAMGEHLASTRAGEAEEEEEVGVAPCGET